MSLIRDIDQIFFLRPFQNALRERTLKHLWKYGENVNEHSHPAPCLLHFNPGLPVFHSHGSWLGYRCCSTTFSAPAKANPAHAALPLNHIHVIAAGSKHIPHHTDSFPRLRNHRQADDLIQIVMTFRQRPALLFGNTQITLPQSFSVIRGVYGDKFH
jgi:hypothetical protein